MSNRIVLDEYPGIFYGTALSNAADFINFIGGNFLGLCEYCNSTLITNHQVGGWGNYGAKSSSKQVSASWIGNCSWTNRRSGMAVRFAANHNNQSSYPECEVKTH